MQKIALEKEKKEDLLAGERIISPFLLANFSGSPGGSSAQMDLMGPAGFLISLMDPGGGTADKLIGSFHFFQWEQLIIMGIHPSVVKIPAGRRFIMGNKFQPHITVRINAPENIWDLHSHFRIFCMEESCKGLVKKFFLESSKLIRYLAETGFSGKISFSEKPGFFPV